jgi:hypothetical protein
MSQAPTVGAWIGLVAALGVGVAVTVAVTALVALVAPSGVWRRTAWQAGTVGLMLLLVGELTGVARGLTDWATFNVGALRSKSTSDDTVAADAIDGPRSIIDWDDLIVAPVERTVGNEFAPSGPELARGDVARGGRADQRNDADLSTQRRWPHGWFESPVGSWWPGIVWSVGTLILAGRVLVGRMLVNVLGRRNGRFVRDVRWRSQRHTARDVAERVQAIARRLGLRRRVRLVVADGLSGPIAFGALRPTIGLPVWFTERFDRTAQDAMFAHELAHLAARDPAWRLVTDLVVTLLWWHPLAWWLRREFRAASELAADEASLLVRDGPSRLAACLVEIGRELTGVRPAAVGIAGSGMRSSLARRVERLLAIAHGRWQPPGHMQAALAKSLGPAALVVVSLLCTGWSSIQQNSVIPTSKGEPMLYRIQNSWRQSLAAVTVAALFGVSDASAAAVTIDVTTDPATVQKDKSDDGAKKEKEDRAAVAADVKEKLARVKREIEELREAGKPDLAEKLAAEARELSAYLEKLQGAKGEKKPESADKLTKKPETRDNGDKEPELADKRPDGGDKKKLDSWADGLLERLKMLEAENAKLREALTLKGKHSAAAAAEEAKRYGERVQKAIQDEHAKVLAAKDGEAREKLEHLAKIIAKLQEEGKFEEAQERKAELRHLAEHFGDVEAQAHKMRVAMEGAKRPDAHSAELGTVIRELREEVRRLRDEVAELRRLVKDRGDEDRFLKK